MTGLYHYYIRYIPGIYFLCKVYTWYILYVWNYVVIYQVYTWYMTGIFLSYTWWLVLWRWTRPHPASATSNDITGPCHDSYSFRITAFAHFTFSNVIVHSPFRHEERRKPPFFARTTHKAFHFGQYRCSSLLGCHSYSAEQDTRRVNGEENALAANSEFRHRIYQVYTRYIPR